jgi:tRNA-specific 2-thiouridylase
MSVLNNNSKTTEKALIAMSGGVDSSVAAKLIIDRGIDCEGCIMVLNGSDGPLSEPEGVSSARAVADRLGMNLHVMDFRDEFKSCVIEPFMEEYFMGHTPNPCIACNKHLKFGRLYEEAEKLGCDYIVTGHYARIEKTGDKYLLKKAKDPMKDQSYVLYNLTQEQLAHTLFLPAGAVVPALGGSSAEIDIPGEPVSVPIYRAVWHQWKIGAEGALFARARW